QHQRQRRHDTFHGPSHTHFGAPSKSWSTTYQRSPDFLRVCLVSYQGFVSFSTGLSLVSTSTMLVRKQPWTTALLSSTLIFNTVAIMPPPRRRSFSAIS